MGWGDSKQIEVSVQEEKVTTLNSSSKLGADGVMVRRGGESGSRDQELSGSPNSSP